MRRSQAHAHAHQALRWLFEKYDGVRGFWNPNKKAMFSRQGRKLWLPEKILDSLPSDTFLDGELWCGLSSNTDIPLTPPQRFGRDTFQEAMKLVSRAVNPDIDWSKFKFMVFDIPTQPGPFSDRYAQLGNDSYLPYVRRTNFLQNRFSITVSANIFRWHPCKYVQACPIWRHSSRIY